MWMAVPSGHAIIMACLDELIATRFGARAFTAGDGNWKPQQYARADPHALVQPREREE
jgi:hypothetical protein